MMRVRGAAVVFALGAMAGCGLLVDTSGLAGGGTASGTDAAIDAVMDAVTDSGSTDTGLDGAQQLDASGDAIMDAPAEGSVACGTPLVAGPFFAADVISLAMGAVPWNSPASAKTDDLLSAVAVMSGGQQSDALVFTQFGVTLPVGAKVSGVTVTVKRRLEGANIVDETLKIFNGVSGSNAKADPAVWKSNFTSVDYGGANDLWGITFPPSQVTSATFGVGLVAKALSGTANSAIVDTISVKVYYCP